MRFLFDAIINYQFKTSQLKNVEKVVKESVQSFNVLLEWIWSVHFCTW